ncbi:hypothetical protein BH10PLA2_BH10PLA2_09000 [soil metagenome]
MAPSSRSKLALFFCSVPSLDFIADSSLVVEEKLDGTNVGIHFTRAGRMVLQCRGHEITSGMHAQYDLFKQWTMGKRSALESMLEDRLILFGEWLYARHSVQYRSLPHYFFEFDIYDKEQQVFLDLNSRLEKLEGTSIHTVPIVQRGPAPAELLGELIGPSQYDSQFEKSADRANRRSDGRTLSSNRSRWLRDRARQVRTP